MAEAEVTVRGCRRGTDERRGQARGSRLLALARPRDTDGAWPQLCRCGQGPARAEARGAVAGVSKAGVRGGEVRGGWWSGRAEGRPRGGRREIDPHGKLLAMRRVPDW